METFATDNNQQIFLDHLFKSLPYYIFWKDRNSVYLGSNENFAKLVGRTPKELVGLTDYNLNWGEGEAEFYRAADQKVMQGMNQVNLEETLVRSDGSEIVMLVSKVPVINPEGKVIGVLGISTDITKAKRAEKELLQAKKEAESANHAIKIFASSIAHELRTPLAAISGYLDGIEAYLPTLIHAYQLAKSTGLSVNKIRSNHFQSLLGIERKIQSEIHYSNTMINMLLMKANSAKVGTAELNICSIKTCIEQAVIRYPYKSSKEASLLKWQKVQDFLFNGNELLLIHILFNLIKNALFHIESVNKGEINIWIEQKENENILNFKDTGKGIVEENLLKIFNLYYSDTPHGAGVGLAFCKQVMESFSGNIICQSEQGKYTHFILIFPKLNNE